MNETLAINASEAAANATQRVPSTPEGMAVAYCSLLVMALLPIFFGSFRSVKYHKEQKVGMPACVLATYGQSNERCNTIW